MEKIKFKYLFNFLKKSNLNASDEDLDGKYPFYTSSAVVSKRTNKPIYEEVALVIGNGGSANIHYADIPFSATSHCYIAIANSKKINPKFVYYYLSTNLHILEMGFKGAGLKNISSKYIEEIEIPFPDLDIQNRIIAVLDKARGLMNKQEKAKTLHDELLRATFLNMFGDPAINSKQWEKVKLESLCSKIIDCPHETPQYLDVPSSYYCVRSSDIQDNYIDLRETKTVSEETYIRRIARHTPKSGEVVYTREGGRLGNAARLPENHSICLGQRMMLFIADESISNNVFIWALLNSDSIKETVRNIAGGGAAPRVNIWQLKELEVFKPPLELQIKFRSIVNKVDKLKELQQRGYLKTVVLLKSIAQLAFNGKLNFNTAVDLEVLLENDYEFFKQNANTRAIQLLIDRLDKSEFNEKKFYELSIYEKAKGFVFELLKEGKIQQVFDEQTKSVKLAVA